LRIPVLSTYFFPQSVNLGGKRYGVTDRILYKYGAGRYIQGLP
jgi:hypothetical protein